MVVIIGILRSIINSRPISIKCDVIVTSDLSSLTITRLSNVDMCANLISYIIHVRGYRCTGMVVSM